MSEIDEAPLTGLYFFPPQHPKPQLQRPPQAAEPQHPEPALPLIDFTNTSTYVFHLLKEYLENFNDLKI